MYHTSVRELFVYVRLLGKLNKQQTFKYNVYDVPTYNWYDISNVLWNCEEVSRLRILTAGLA